MPWDVSLFIFLVRVPCAAYICMCASFLSWRKFFFSCKRSSLRPLTWDSSPSSTSSLKIWFFDGIPPFLHTPFLCSFFLPSFLPVLISSRSFSLSMNVDIVSSAPLFLLVKLSLKFSIWDFHFHLILASVLFGVSLTEFDFKKLNNFVTLSSYLFVFPWTSLKHLLSSCSSSMKCLPMSSLNFLNDFTKVMIDYSFKFCFLAFT